MPLDLPESASEVDARSKADVQGQLNQSNPFGKNHWLGAIVTGAANRIYDFYIQLRTAIRVLFPDTATEEYATRWGAIFGVSKLAATRATGFVVATGTAGSAIASGIVLNESGGGVYESTGAATISANTISIASLSRSGTTVTATTDSNHNLANNVEVTIANASDSAYNGAFSIVVTGLNKFQYEIIGTPADEPATPADASFTTAHVPVQSQGFGADTNLDAGTELTLESPIVGVDDTLAVDFGTLGGGTDQETDESFRLRYLDRIQNPVAHFNSADIIQQAKLINGVTRVFVQEITPAVGQVTIYFMRDNDDNPIPDASEVTTVKNKILEITPANTDSADVIVSAPTAVTVDFTFTALNPDTSTMRTAIENNLAQFFEERTEVAVNIDEDAYRSAIYNSIDTATGNTLTSFTISAPVGDITISTGEIGVLGTVTFP